MFIRLMSTFIRIEQEQEATKEKPIRVAEEESTLRLKCRENLQGVPEVSQRSDTHTISFGGL